MMFVLIRLNLVIFILTIYLDTVVISTEISGGQNSTLELASKLQQLSMMLSKHSVVLTDFEQRNLLQVINGVVPNDTSKWITTTTTTTPKPPRRAFKSEDVHRLKDIIPVDLNSPCDLDEQTNLDLFEDYYEQIKTNNSDELQQDLLKDTDDYLLGYQANYKEDSDRARLTLTKLVGKSKIGFDLLQDMIFKANHLQSIVMNMIRKNLISDCPKLQLENVWEIHRDSYVNSNLVDSLSNIYQTLTNQTAHLYYIWIQQRKHFRSANGCGHHSFPVLVGEDSGHLLKQLNDWKVNRRQHVRKVAADFLAVSYHLRGLMCQFKQVFRLFELSVPSEQIVEDVMEHTIEPDISCLRMSIFDCLIMRNAVKIFADVEEFLRSQSGRFFK